MTCRLQVQLWCLRSVVVMCTFGFCLDPTIGEFCPTRERLCSQGRRQKKVYQCNEGNSACTGRTDQAAVKVFKSSEKPTRLVMWDRWLPIFIVPYSLRILYLLPAIQI
jgi:fructose-1,6-bisphosphatase